MTTQNKIAVLVFLFGLPTFAGMDAMKNMPKIKPTKIHTVETTQAGEDLLDQRGFGDQESSVKMMNLMMVEGSGYEGMEMGHGHGMQIAENESKPGATAGLKYEVKTSPAAVKIGANTVTITVTDANGSPQKNLKPKAQVSMTSMDMGTEEPRVRETAPGQYQLKANFTMKGPWAVKMILPGEEKVFNFNVGPGK